MLIRLVIDNSYRIQGSMLGVTRAWHTRDTPGSPIYISIRR